MKLVIDTNKIISALIKDSLSRKIMINDYFELITPDYTLDEINKYKKEIIERTNINEEEFEILNNILFQHIKIISKESYNKFFDEAKKLIDDVKDVPFIALALANNCGIWSEDKDFQRQKTIKVFKTEDLIKLI